MGRGVGAAGRDSRGRFTEGSEQAAEIALRRDGFVAGQQWILAGSEAWHDTHDPFEGTRMTDQPTPSDEQRRIGDDRTNTRTNV